MATPAHVSGAGSYPFTDGLGTRTVIAEKGGEVLELLRITTAFALVPRFESALRERVARLANFRHTYFARVRRVDRLDGAGGLGLVSEHPAGARLSHVLDVAERHGLELDINAALCLMRQLVPAVGTLHENARDVAHGALAPERILVTAHARVVVTDHVLGSAIDQLRLPRERLWRDLQIAVPPGAGDPILDHRADVMQLGVVSLSLVLGRTLRLGDLRSLPELVASATETTVLGDRAPVSGPLRRWLLRALQADPRGSFETAAEAHHGLEDVLSDEGGYIAAPVALEAFLRKYQELASGPAPGSEVPADTQPEPAQPAPAPRDATHGGIARRDAARHEAVPVPAAAVEASVPAAPAADAAAPRQPQDLHSPPPQPAPAPVVTPSRSVPSGTLSIADAAADPAGTGDAQTEEAGPVAGRRWERIALAMCLVIVLLEGGTIWWLAGRTGLRPSSTATLVIESRPAGLSVVVDGDVRGTTPLTLAVRPGVRVIELRGGRDSRVLPLTVEAGRTYMQYVEVATTELTGAIEIREYRGARVLVNGQLRGTAPLRIADLAPGTHELVLETRLGRVRQTVEVRPGLTTSFGTTVTAGQSAAAASAARSGHVRVTAPFEMDVFIAGRRIGTTGDTPFELPAGRHAIEVVSSTLAFRTVKEVEIAGGRETALSIELPQGVLTLDATPPADVWLDGTRLGETPLIDVPVTIGPHEVTFRHPEHGEQHHAIVVTASTPARLRARFE